MERRLTRRAARTGLAALVAGLLLQQGDAGYGASDGTAKARPAKFGAAATAALGGLFPGGVTVADFTGDGRPDVAAAVASVQPVPGVVVVAGNGQGGFTDRVSTSLPGDLGGCDIATGDLDGDGDADLAVSACGSGSSPVILLLGNGDGTFDVSQQIAVGFALSHPAIGDLNGDGDADLAVARESGGTSVYFGKGDGTVGTATDYPVMNSDSLRILDVTGDGKPDLSFTGPATMVNKGDGTFSAPVGADFFAIASVVVDLDGDGIPDGAGVDGSGRHVFIGHGTGDGRYTLVTTLTLSVQQTLSITGGDFTGDGRADLVVNGDGQTVYLLVGTGDGTVKKPVGYATGPQHLTAASLGGSSAADLISLSEDPGTAYGVLGGRTGLEAAQLVPSQVPGEIATGDVDGDGRNDVVTAGGILPEDGGIWSALGADLGRGKGRFSATKTTLVREESASSGVAALVLADVDLDGRLDAVGGFENFQFNPSNIFVARGLGNGRFADSLMTDNGDQSGDVLAVAVGDVTGDGKPDVVSNTRIALSVLPGKGDGTFKKPIVSGSGGLEQTQTLLGDVTGDGILDVVATMVTGNNNFASADLVLEKGDGAGHFVEVQRISVDSNIRGAALVDLDGDGRLDLAADGHGGTDGGRSGLFILLGKAGGTFQAPVYYASGGGQLVAADLNLDGSVDLAVDGPTSTTDIDLNRGDGTFALGQRLVTASGPAAVGDVTGDGSPDLLSNPSASQQAFGLAVNLRH